MMALAQLKQVREDATMEARFLLADHRKGMSIQDTMTTTWIDPASELAYIEVSGDALAILKDTWGSDRRE